MKKVQKETYFPAEIIGLIWAELITQKKLNAKGQGDEETEKSAKIKKQDRDKEKSSSELNPSSEREGVKAFQIW